MRNYRFVVILICGLMLLSNRVEGAKWKLALIRVERYGNAGDGPMIDSLIPYGSPMTDCLDLCKFSTFAESLDDFAAQFSTFTGMEVTAADLLAFGDRVYNLERYYNNLAGIGEGSDYLPKRFQELPADGQGSEGALSEIDVMLAEYYEERGWVNGVVPESKLKELGIL